MRYGQKENLDFLLPNVNNYVGNPIHFNTSMVVNNHYTTADGQFDMFVHHTRYSQDVKSVMRQGTTFVTILRDPTSLFQSIYSFYHLERKYKTNLSEFITNHLLDNTFSIKRYSNKLGLNQMSWDLGLNPNNFNSKEAINRHLDMVEKDFDFIMIFEYLDASLVLFADLMQWPLEYIAYLPLNMRNNTYRQILSERDRNNLRKVSMADNMLYKRFVLKFKEKIKQYGIKKLKRKIGQLMVLNQEIIDCCVQSTTNRGYAKTISYKLKEKTSTICKYIAINELEYTSLLRKTQYEKLRKFKELDKLIYDN